MKNKIMDEQDCRWLQRFENYKDAFKKITEAIVFIKDNEISVSFSPIASEILKEGLIQRFEYTHELAWNVMKDYAEYQGNANVGGSRDAVREALQLKLIANGDIWMDMIKSRNITSHTYNKDTADEIYQKVIDEYYDEFAKFADTMKIKAAKCFTD